MASRRTNGSEEPKTRSRPATTPEGREHQLINLAIDEAERQIRNKEASAQVITHFLKLGSSREQVEQARIRAQVDLDVAKIQALADAAKIEVMYKDAIAAMQSYGGEGVPTQDFDSAG